MSKQKSKEPKPSAEATKLANERRENIGLLLQQLPAREREDLTELLDRKVDLLDQLHVAVAIAHRQTMGVVKRHHEETIAWARWQRDAKHLRKEAKRLRKEGDHEGAAEKETQARSLERLDAGDDRAAKTLVPLLETQRKLVDSILGHNPTRQDRIVVEVIGARVESSPKTNVGRNITTAHDAEFMETEDGAS